MKFPAPLLILAILMLADISFSQPSSCNLCQDFTNHSEGEIVPVQNEFAKTFDVSFFYRNLSGSLDDRKPVENAVILVVIQNPDAPSYAPEIYFDQIKTNSEGQASFDFSPYENGCFEYTFLYCHSTFGCAYDACLTAAGVNTSLVGAPTIVLDPAQNPSKIRPVLEKVTRCPFVPSGAFESIPVFCLPLILIFGLLGGALYMSGRNPFGMFDFSVTRLSKPFRYTPRSRSLTGGDIMAPIRSTASLVSEVKVALHGTAAEKKELAMQKANPLMARLVKGADERALKKRAGGGKAKGGGKKGEAERQAQRSPEAQSTGAPLMFVGDRLMQVGGGSAPIVSSLGKALKSGSFLTGLAIIGSDMLLYSSVGAIYQLAGSDKVDRAIRKSIASDAVAAAKEYEEGDGKMFLVDSPAEKHGTIAEGEQTWVAVKVVKNETTGEMGSVQILKIVKLNGKEVSREAVREGSAEYRQYAEKALDDYVGIYNRIAAHQLTSIREIAADMGVENETNSLFDKYDAEREEQIAMLKKKEEAVSGVEERNEIRSHIERLENAGEGDFVVWLREKGEAKRLTPQIADVMRVYSSNHAMMSSAIMASQALATLVEQNRNFDIQVSEHKGALGKVGGITDSNLQLAREYANDPEALAQRLRTESKGNLQLAREYANDPEALAQKLMERSKSLGQDEARAVAVALIRSKDSKPLGHNESGAVANILIRNNELSDANQTSLVAAHALGVTAAKHELYKEDIISREYQSSPQRGMYGIADSTLYSLMSASNVNSSIIGLNAAASVGSGALALPSGASMDFPSGLSMRGVIEQARPQEYRRISPAEYASNRILDDQLVVIIPKAGQSFLSTYGTEKEALRRNMYPVYINQYSAEALRVKTDDSSAVQAVVRLNPNTLPLASGDEYLAQYRAVMNDTLGKSANFALERAVEYSSAVPRSESLRDKVARFTGADQPSGYGDVITSSQGYRPPQKEEGRVPVVPAEYEPPRKMPKIPRIGEAETPAPSSPAAPAAKPAELKGEKEKEKEVPEPIKREEYVDLFASGEKEKKLAKKGGRKKKGDDDSGDYDVDI